MLEEKSAGVVIYRNENNEKLFLILNYPSGHWDFVKGKMEKDETEHHTAIRETKEETGIDDLKFTEGFEQTIEYNFQYDNTSIHKQVVFFLAETKIDKIVLSHEHLNYTWMNFDDALKKVTFENARSVLTNAKSFIKN